MLVVMLVVMLVAGIAVGFAFWMRGFGCGGSSGRRLEELLMLRGALPAPPRGDELLWLR